MAKNKTTETFKGVDDFINAISDETKRQDSLRIIELMKNEIGFEPKMWGSSIIGFGSYHYKYESGHEGDMPLVCFSPRKIAIVFYISLNAAQRAELLQKLGKHKTGKGCIYVKKLDDINIGTLQKMILASVTNNSSLF